MNQNPTQVKRALLSVSNKTGIVEFARALEKLNIEIISTGGTCKTLQEAKIKVIEISDITKFPEMMHGRVKTLHPKIHGGILGLRDEHSDEADQHNIEWIDLVVVNLYPFAETIKKIDSTLDVAIENIDIGGPTLIRSAAKNFGWVNVLVDPADYEIFLQELNQQNTISFSTRKKLATKAFAHTAQYDALIHQYLASDPFPNFLTLALEKLTDLRYGENPHQTASAYQFVGHTRGILSAKKYQGKQLSFNNITDADAAVTCVKEFTQPACVIVKHANPCGVAIAENIYQAFNAAFEADPTSAFGGIIAINRTCDELTAKAINEVFFEVLIAPEYTKEALEILSKKPNLRVLEFPIHHYIDLKHEIKFIDGGLLIQDRDFDLINENTLKIVTKRSPSVEEKQTMMFAWPIVKQLKSNAILIAKHNVTLGVGTGQVSRIDAVDMALKKAGNKLEKAILASDAFFPFRDTIDRLANTGIKAIIQPGGGIRDQEVIDACDEYNIAMVFTGKRCFKH